MLVAFIVYILELRALSCNYNLLSFFNLATGYRFDLAIPQFYRPIFVLIRFSESLITTHLILSANLYSDNHALLFPRSPKDATLSIALYI